MVVIPSRPVDTAPRLRTVVCHRMARSAAAMGRPRLRTGGVRTATLAHMDRVSAVMAHLPLLRRTMDVGAMERFLGHGASHHVSGHAPAASARGRPIAAGAHLFSQPETFTVKEKVISASGDSFNVKDAAGRLRYLVDGTTFTMRQRKRLLGPAKEPLLGMSQERMSLRSRMVISDSTGRPAVTLRKRGFVSGMGNSTVYAWWGSDPDASSPFLEVKGDVFKKSYKITEVGSGAEVGTVKRHAMSIKNFATDKDDFTLTVQPGYDCAFMVLLVVALDEMYTDDN
ncbi:hypothetical protein I4F81_006486 [Pyropia yezoensis]|uniref:Uncharacterized protein n=1 Tax=Pyropia yezoensis TaxID=2788 RepID=A0ACC3C1F7_PYRYE|nr:hypothetical protein I4F81_006486 [Neopyropia yezoensis]